MAILRFGVLCSTLQLLCGPACVLASLDDAAVLIQQELRREQPRPHIHPAGVAAQGKCTPLPRPLEYSLDQFSGAYGPMTVEWSDSEFDHAAKLGRKGAYEQLVPLLQKLRQGETLRIVVFGGSSTAGMHCHQHHLVAKECSWPRRFQHWLRRAFPHATIDLANFAQGAATSSSILVGSAMMLKAYDSDKQGSQKGADIIFVDTLVNDVYQKQKEGGKDLSHTNNMATKSAIAYEQLLRTLHKLQPQAVIFPVLSGCALCNWYGTSHRQAINHYNLPHLDWSDFVAWKTDLWDGPDAHPNYWFHQSLADVLAMLWGSVWKETECVTHLTRKAEVNQWQSSYFSPEQLSTYQPCLEPLSAYDASIPETTKGVRLGEGWSLYEDRPGKPGWITEKSGARMAFPLRFGKHPVLVITWMRSYERLGYATLQLNGVEYRLEGLWTEGLQENVTLAHSRWLQVDRPRIQPRASLEMGVAGFSIMPWENHTMVIQNSLDHLVRYPKMKIMQVFSC